MLKSATNRSGKNPREMNGYVKPLGALFNKRADFEQDGHYRITKNISKYHRDGTPDMSFTSLITNPGNIEIVSEDGENESNPQSPCCERKEEEERFESEETPTHPGPGSQTEAPVTTACWVPRAG